MLTFLFIATVIVALGVVTAGRDRTGSAPADRDAQRVQNELAAMRAYSGGALLS
ncbi:hypothetical protein [Nocardia sp. XZ_19_385]|uniref:hypothetical protein n=1 Tax=Nocardia sp. XZ_19_385 TaxID=2769488 RepID=UPI00188FC683|nr:hypothetical protein [Nocardia sp. XZ_19_385]